MQNFEEKLEKSKKILDKLSNEDISVEDLVKGYKEGIKLLNEADDILQKAKLEIEEVDKNSTTDI